MKKQVKGWAEVDTQYGFVVSIALHRSVALKNRRESLEDLPPKEQRKWKNQLKVVPCTITYEITSK